MKILNEHIVYWIVYFSTKVVSFFVFPRRIRGLENIPKTGGVILACNHVSYMDPVVMGISCGRRIHFVARDSLFNGLLGYVLPRLGAFPIKRDSADVKALKETLRRLKCGWPVLIFPEGTRKEADKKVNEGIGFIAVKSGAPVVPVFIQGTDKVLPAGAKTLKRSQVEVRFGKPLIFTPDQTYGAAAQAIIHQIYSLQ